MQTTRQLTHPPVCTRVILSVFVQAMYSTFCKTRVCAAGAAQSTPIDISLARALRSRRSPYSSPPAGALGVLPKPPWHLSRRGPSGEQDCAPATVKFLHTCGFPPRRSLALCPSLLLRSCSRTRDQPNAPPSIDLINHHASIAVGAGAAAAATAAAAASTTGGAASTAAASAAAASSTALASAAALSKRRRPLRGTFLGQLGE